MTFRYFDPISGSLPARPLEAGYFFLFSDSLPSGKQSCSPAERADRTDPEITKRYK